MDKWRENLDQSLGQAPAAPADELERILRRARAERPLGIRRSQGQLWPALLCAGSLAFGVLVSVFVKPATESGDGVAASVSLLSIEATTPFDESLERLDALSEQVP